MTILLIDDHPIVLEGIKSLLTPMPSATIITATNAAMARKHIASRKIDIMVTDLELPDESGLSLVSHLHERQPSAKVAIYTMHEEAWTMHDILDCAPEAVVMKCDAPTELINAVKALAMGKGFYSPSFCKMLHAAHTNPDRLSLREQQVLAMTAEGLSTKEAAQRLGVSANTVEFHRRRIMMKLHAANAVEMVLRAKKLGWNT